MKSRLHLAVGLAGVVALGCSDLDEFSTGPNEAYCGGVIVGADFRTGITGGTQMRLTFDAAALDGPDSPGKLWTYAAADPSNPERNPEVRLIDAAPLRPIVEIAHDPISHLEFGDGRDRNAIFGVSPADPDADSLLAVVSLRSDHSVEVRLVRGGAAPADGKEPPATKEPVFALFSLKKQVGACGF